jgi:membrane protease YdiL (CAAX protease family)
VEEWIEPIRILIALAVTLLLVLLRLEAEKFGVAEYDEPTPEGQRAPVLHRLSWFLLGGALIGALLIVHPDPADDLGLALGDRAQALFLGLGLGVLGTLQAAAFALYRYGRIRYPPPWAYPGAVANAVGTALVDEATFRGAVLGLLLLVGLDPLPAIAGQAFLHTLATRTGAPGRGFYMFVLTLVGGFVAGWAAVTSGAIAASFLGHAVTRVAVFVCTGHAGRPAPRGQEIEEGWESRRPPDGWQALDEDDRPEPDR